MKDIEYQHTSCYILWTLQGWATLLAQCKMEEVHGWHPKHSDSHSEVFRINKGCIINYSSV